MCIHLSQIKKWTYITQNVWIHTWLAYIRIWNNTQNISNSKNHGSYLLCTNNNIWCLHHPIRRNTWLLNHSWHSMIQNQQEMMSKSEYFPWERKQVRKLARYYLWHEGTYNVCLFFPAASTRHAWPAAAPIQSVWICMANSNLIMMSINVENWWILTIHSLDTEFNSYKHPVLILCWWNRDLPSYWYQR